MPRYSRYSFRDGAILTFRNAKDADPQVIGSELDRISQAQGGRLDPNDVVIAATPHASVLHKHFEWDAEKAAHAFRVSQAREIIGSIHVITGKRRLPARGFLSIVDDVGGRSYRRLEEVLTSRSLQVRLLEQAQADLEAFERRFRELTDICSLVRKAREKISDRKNEIEVRPQ